MHKDFLFPSNDAMSHQQLSSTSLPLSMPPDLMMSPSVGLKVSQAEHHVRNFYEQLMASSDLFEVTIQRNSLGLGLSIMNSEVGLLKHFICVKKLFPLQPAWQTGLLRPGDILLRANQYELIGMNLRQALDILRCGPATTNLLVCRPRPEFLAEVLMAAAHSSSTDHAVSSPSKFNSSVLRSYSYTPATRQLSLSMPNAELSGSCSRQPETDADMDTTSAHHAHQFFSSTPEVLSMTHGRRGSDAKGSGLTQSNLFSPIINNNNNTSNDAMNDSDAEFYGEFTVVLHKINGSLGFTLYSQSDDSTILRHSVKALVKEPALSNGQIRPGDKLIAANNIECGHLSHDDLIRFLRNCPEEVTLRFYRDNSRSQTPVSTPQRPSAPSIRDPITAGAAIKSFFFSEKTKVGQKFFSSGSSSLSHPDLTTMTSASGLPKSKQLRAEAKEMVRSLQASRNSLERTSCSNTSASTEARTKNGSNASGGGGSRRKIRPFSPARDRPLPTNPISQSASAPSPFPKHLVVAVTATPVDSQYSFSNSPVASPTVESPTTPAGGGSADAAHPIRFCSAGNEAELDLGVHRLHIEELPVSYNNNFEHSGMKHQHQQQQLPMVHSNYIVGASGSGRLARPNHLDLFQTKSSSSSPAGNQQQQQHQYHGHYVFHT